MGFNAVGYTIPAVIRMSIGWCHYSPALLGSGAALRPVNHEHAIGLWATLVCGSILGLVTRLARSTGPIFRLLLVSVFSLRNRSDGGSGSETHMGGNWARFTP